MSTEQATKPTYKNSAEYWEERVPVFIEESENETNLPINVSVNGETITVARGVEVMVKRKFAEVINSMKSAKREERAFARKKANAVNA